MSPGDDVPVKCRPLAQKNKKVKNCIEASEYVDTQ
jgi:hypothetical protein